MLVKILLPHQAVTPHRQALVGGEDHDRLSFEIQGSQLFEQSAEVMVEGRNGGIVVVQMFANLMFRARPGGQAFVAHREFAVVERMERQIVLRQRNRVGLILRLVRGRSDARIVRVAERQVHEERSLRIALRLEERDRFIDDFPARLAAQAFLFVVLQILIDLEAGLNVRGRVAALAVVVGLVARRLQGERKVRRLARRENIPLVARREFARDLLGSGGIARARLKDVAAFRMHQPAVVEERLAAEHHVAARRTDGPGVAAEIIRVLKCQASGGQGIERRRANRRVAERGDGVGPLIVGVEKENIRRRGTGGIAGDAQADHDQQRQKSFDHIAPCHD